MLIHKIISLLKSSNKHIQQGLYRREGAIVNCLDTAEELRYSTNGAYLDYVPDSQDSEKSLDRFNR